jgi:Ni,Fe-hydrogenase III large subunit
MTVTAPVGSAYRDRVAAALAAGWQARSLYAAADGQLVRIALTAADGRSLIETVAADSDGAVPSVADLVPAMAWDEREAHDLHGITFTGHEPMRPLANHGAPLAEWTVPVRGHDPYQVAVGPIHAGVIESGHFRFHVVGDKILHLDARLFYKHRGLERAAEGQPITAALAVVSRACAACTAANGVAYSIAAEQALGLRAAPQLARARALLVELERVWNHLNDIAAVCAGTGMAAGNAWFLALTEQARRLNASLTGHRFLFGSVQVGGSTLTIDAGTVSRCARELAGLRAAAESGWRELEFNASFQDRLGGVGIVAARDCSRLGVVGPAARAAGLAEDARAVSPYPGHDAFRPVTPENAAGDVKDRLGQRMLELRQAFAILEVLLDQGPLLPAEAVVGDAPGPVGFGITESPRGATTCIIERAGDAVRRVRLRTASYANWPAVAHAAAGSLLPDFPLINKSFELCYACADR